MAPGAFAGLNLPADSQRAQLPAASTSQNKSAKAVVRITNPSGGPVANAAVSARRSGLVIASVE
jgi:hypothetical protein